MNTALFFLRVHIKLNCFIKLMLKILFSCILRFYSKLHLKPIKSKT